MMMKLTTFCAHLFRNSRYNLLKSKKIFVSSNNHFREHINQCSNFSFCIPPYFLAGFHSTSILAAKSFQERENEYAHSVMENIVCYDNSLVKFPLDIKTSHSSESAKELSEFVEVTKQSQQRNLSLEDKNFSLLIRNITNILPDVSDEDLIEFLHNLCLWPSSPKSWSPNFKAIWNGLDYQCTKRLNSWDLNRKLLVADYWFCLRLNRISQYNKNLILELLKNLDSLSDDNVVQLMFYINLQRNVPQLYMRNLEERLLSVINKVTIEEVGVICLGFFKTENKISDFNIIQSIINRFCIEVENTNTVTVNAILKFLKKSLHLPQTSCYIPLLHKCVRCVSSWDIPTCMQLALLSSECHVYHPLLLDTVTEKLADGIEQARLKDCAKLLQCLSHFNHFPKAIFHERYFRELKKKSRYSEIEAYPRDLAYSMLYYAYLGHFDYKVLRTILGADFVDHCLFTNPETKNSFAEIDYCVEIECSDYNGPRLPKDYLQVLDTRRGNLPHTSDLRNTLARCISEVVQSLETILDGKKDILVRHILPHCFTPDIIVRLSASPKSMASLYKMYPSTSILVPPRDETWVCFVLASSFSFAYKSLHLTGVTAMKLRQLKKLGYKVVFVSSHDLPMNELLRKKFVKEKLESLQICSESKVSVEI